MPKEGFVREDGMVYWRRHTTRGDVWLTAEKYQEYCQKRKAYRTMCREAYYRRQAELPPEERNYFGKYNWKTNKYFVDVTASGKEFWVYKKRFEELAARRKGYRRRYLDKMHKLPKAGLKIGDTNPDNPNEYVLHFTGNMPRFGTLEQLQTSQEGRKISYKKMHAKYRKIRREKLKWMSNKLKRGTIDPETGMIFWEYGRFGQPVWLPPEQFTVKHEVEKARRRKNRALKKAKEQETVK